MQSTSDKKMSTSDRGKRSEDGSLNAVSPSNGESNKSPPLEVPPGEPKASYSERQNGNKVIVSSAEPSHRTSPLRSMEETKQPEAARPDGMDDGTLSRSVSTEPGEAEEESSVVTNSSSSESCPLSNEAAVDAKSKHESEKATKFSNGAKQLTEKSVEVDNPDVLTKESQQLRPQTPPLASLKDGDESEPKSNTSVHNEPLCAEKGNDQDEIDTKVESLIGGLKSKVGTFASLTPYIDASTTHPDVCPCGGSWKGYFENVQVR